METRAFDPCEAHVEKHETESQARENMNWNPVTSAGKHETQLQARENMKSSCKHGKTRNPDARVGKHANGAKRKENCD